MNFLSGPDATYKNVGEAIRRQRHQVFHFPATVTSIPASPVRAVSCYSIGT